MTQVLFFLRIYQTCFPQAKTAGGSRWVSFKFFYRLFPAYNLYVKAKAAEAARREHAALNPPQVVPPALRRVRVRLTLPTQPSPPSPPPPPEEEPSENMSMEVDELEVSVTITLFTPDF
jgi:hypothetical protein